MTNPLSNTGNEAATKYLHRGRYLQREGCKYLHRGRYLQREGCKYLHRGSSRREEEVYPDHGTRVSPTKALRPGYSRSVEDRSTQSNCRLPPFWLAPLTIPAHCPVRTPTNRPLYELSFPGRPEYPPQVKLFPQKSPNSTWYTDRGWFGVRLLRAANFCLKGRMKVLELPKKRTQIAGKVNFSRV